MKCGRVMFLTDESVSIRFGGFSLRLGRPTEISFLMIGLESHVLIYFTSGELSMFHNICEQNWCRSGVSVPPQPIPFVDRSHLYPRIPNSIFSGVTVTREFFETANEILLRAFVGERRHICPSVSSFTDPLHSRHFAARSAFLRERSGCQHFIGSEGPGSVQSDRRHCVRGRSVADGGEELREHPLQRSAGNKCL